MEGLENVTVEAAISGRCGGKGVAHTVDSEDEVAMAMTDEAEALAEVEVMFTSIVVVVLLLVFLYLFGLRLGSSPNGLMARGPPTLP